MKTKVRMIIMSHLSDIQQMMIMRGPLLEANHKVNFLKYLVMKYPNTAVEIDADAEMVEFEKKFPRLKDGGILNKKVTFKQLFK